jgi:DNA-binding NtrC family response regulator
MKANTDTPAFPVAQEVITAGIKVGRGDTSRSPSSPETERLIGTSPSMRRVYAQIEQAAAADIPVLLLGETGTGKDLVARTIHGRSRRSRAPYLAVNLASLPTEMVASELFGHEKGAFTGAIDRRQGVFERGSDGTVFLDEIDSIDERVRVSLLRLIEDRAFTRLGGSTRISTSARLIAASNSDLEEAVREGSFRKDLFYRLDAFRIVMPPLRERPGDIPLLIGHFLDRYNRELGTDIRRISSDCADILQGYDWPGNVREVKNVIQRAMIVCDDGELNVDHLPPRFLKRRTVGNRVTFAVGTPLHEIERTMVVRALAVSGNNRKKAAELLGISRRAIYNKLNKYDIAPKRASHRNSEIARGQ